MFSRIAAFELRYQLRNPVFVATFAIFALLAFGNVTSDNIQIGSVGNVNLDSPDAIIQAHLTMSLIAIFIVTAFLSNIVLRDAELGTAEIFYSTRLTKRDYLLGRFAGAFVVACLAFAAVSVGMIIGTLWPTLDPERLGGFHAGYYAYALFVLGLPNLLLSGAIAFAVATLTRSLMFTYVGIVAFITLYGVSQNFLSEPELRSIAALLDPFGIAAYTEMTRYWTAFERNAQLLPIEGLLLYNRLLWLGVALVLIGLAYSRFAFETESRKSRRRRRRGVEAAPEAVVTPRPAVAAPAVEPRFDTATVWRQFALRVRFETWSVVRSVPFLVLAALGVALSLVNFFTLDQLFGTPVYPVTRVLIAVMSGTYTLSLMIVVVYYSAEIVWNERQVGFNEILDATPVPNWVFAGSKLVALLAVIAILLAIGVVVSAATQLAMGYTRIELGQYLTRYLGEYGFTFYAGAVLALLAQVLVRNKFLGMGVMLLYIVSLFVLVPMGLEDPLYRFGIATQAPYSDMNGWGHYGRVVALYTLYWSFFCVLLFLAAHVLWRRGTLDTFGNQLRRARHALTRPVLVTAGLAAVGFAATGAYLYYNTHVLNEYLVQTDIEQRQLEYEQRYRQYEHVPQPRIVDVYTEVDLYPHQQRYAARGRYLLENKTDAPIDTLYVGVDSTAEVDRLEVAGGTVRAHDAQFNYTIFDLAEPLAPGARLTLEFETRRENPGFLHRRNQTALIDNGSFFNNIDAMPYLAFNETYLLVDRNRRRNHGMEPIDRLRKLEDESAHDDSCLRKDSDWVQFETVVSTAADQTAIAPGYLQREWSEDGRRYFHYRMDAPMHNFFSYLSADYERAHEEWNGIDIEVYYHPPHDFNVERMITSVKKSLAYFSENFSPYQYRQMRIIEFPISAGRFAQSFPNTVPWSEGIGFIARVEKPTDIDYVFYVGAHEMAHQWWAHQVACADVQGSTALAETLSQYSALMVMEHEYGPHVMRRFLKYELDRYLSGRGGEIIEELPLYRVENQPYIHYRKGSVVMYALKDYLGEDAINRALANLIAEKAYRSDPYPTTRDLLRHLRAQARTEAQQQLITDLWERITVFDLSVDDAEVRETDDGRYAVSMTVDAAKFEADGEGREEERPLDMDIDIGLFAEDPGAEGFGEDDVIYLAKHRITDGESELTLTVDRRPVRVGIDPYNKLIDRNTDDNLERPDR